MDIKLSQYAKCLANDVQKRYIEKISIINFIDPYIMKKCELNFDVENYPKVTYPDIVNYLLFAPSAYTAEQLKTYKSLDGYNQFINGWVKDVGVKIFGDIALLQGRVLHSQRLCEPPLLPWVICNKGGQVISAHCNCMAGLGESCTHIAATLFFIEASVKEIVCRTVTQVKAYWVDQSKHVTLQSQPISNTDFTAPKTLKRKLENNELASTSSSTINIKKPVEKPTKTSLDNLFHKLSLGVKKPVVLSIIRPYSDKYEPETISEKYPKILSELYNPAAIEKNYLELLDISREVIPSLKITEEQQNNVEILTREQHNCKQWYRFRAGRITASNMHAVFHTDANMPSMSILKSVCYVNAHTFTAGMRWGCENEKNAFLVYKNYMEENHQNFFISKCGFYISVEEPFIGASPDAVTRCDCCGEGCLEIKCPFTAKDKTIPEAIANLNFFCLDPDHQLPKNHAYFSQIQTQIHVCKKEFCDLIVWTKIDYHVVRIYPDSMHWSKLVEKAQIIFENGVLPELIGKCFTRVSALTVSTTSDRNEYCYCKGKEDGELFLCAKSDCKIKYFHLKCLNLKHSLKKKWICPECRNLNNKVQ